MNRKWKVFLIHHSHTDIGYTERQDKITRYHSDFIKQAIKILDNIHEKNLTEYQGFKWQCENFWQVQQFWKSASETEKEHFAAYVRSGEIGVSGNYLNMTDLVLEKAFDNVLSEMDAFSKKLGHIFSCGMCADVNGLAWGYPDILYKHGVQCFYTALHPHHGMFPLYKKVQPYYWETPKGNKLLMWNGDHYHVGNEMFFSPHAGSNYTFFDEYSSAINNNQILNKDPDTVDKDELQICTTRIQRYLENLESEKYPYDLVPFMVSGAITDNAPPSIEIAKRVHELNEYFHGDVIFQMATLEDFFDAVKASCDDIPTYRGDFTDWWADGVGSTPAATKIYLDAARKYQLCEKLDAKHEIASDNLMMSAAKNLMLYAEHTWGYSSSVSEPWDSMVEQLEYKKTAYATNANTEVSSALDHILASKGEVSIQQGKPQHYIVINPHAQHLHTTCYLYIEYWEYIDGLRYDSTMPIIVSDSETGEHLPSQVKRIARATQVEVEIDMAAEMTRHLEIHLDPHPYYPEITIRNHAHIGADGVQDILSVPREDEEEIDTDFFDVYFDGTHGIQRIIWKKDGTDLLRADRKQAPFAGIYEITDIVPDPCTVRKLMGRNRKAYNTRRYQAVLQDRRIRENGDVYTAIELNYALKGTRIYSVFLKIYKHIPQIEINVRVHKTSHWEPENLYIPLPFTAGGETVFYVNKTGCIMRPGIDQLPGTCQDFYLVQDALVWKNKKRCVSVITKDAPLIAMGDLEAKRIRLCDPTDKTQNERLVYSWPMNNFWETNFKVDLAGFYEFRYLFTVNDNADEKETFVNSTALDEGIITGYEK